MGSAGSPARDATRLPDQEALELATSAASIKIWLEPMTSPASDPRGKTVVVALQVTIRPARRPRRRRQR
jgi:hypothetical protein